MLFGLFNKKTSDSQNMLYRKSGLLNQIDFLLDTLENNKFDILYMENLKQPLSPDEKVYFIQQIDRIESAKNILFWLKGNIKTNESFWKRFLRW